ncbi:uncharacterized protein C9orf50 homolog [Sturnira hondurensis]|uniref:uncharacterized protein C9orf50 homolog n=1 Tax=Sturnira hondurensis TaxID=192404 RepID=UPI00187A0F29|nr:uncharacterized protein C9orf50 homolog [Sturnira hondurensis]
MPWRHPNLRAQQVARKGFSGEGSRRRRDLGPPGLPGLPPRELGSAPGAWRSRGSRASRGSAEWWPASSAESSPKEPGVDVWSTQLRLPPLPTMAPRAARSRTGLRSLLLPPRHPRPEEWEDSWRGSARKTHGSLGSLLGEFLPRRFREFLNQLGAEWVEQPQPPPPTSSKSPHQRGVSGCCRGPSPPSPDCSFLLHPRLMPDVAYLSSRCRSLQFQNSLKKSSLDHIPTLRPLRRDLEQFIKVKKANRPHGLGVPKLKAELTHSSSEESSGHHRRCSPFRVRFADETAWDTAFRYWERSRARKQAGQGAPNSRVPACTWESGPCGHGCREEVQQDLTEHRPATQPEAALEPAFGSVRKWVESLPKALDSQAKEEAAASSPFSWDSPSLPTPQLEDYLSEDTAMNSSLPYIPRATTQRQLRDGKSFLGTHRILDQVGKSPSSWSQKLESFLPRLELHSILNRGRPKGYQLLLPSVTRQQSEQ